MSRARVLSVFILLVIPVLLSAEDFKMRSSELAPAATATIEANTDRNGNVDMTLNAKHMAPPDRLSQPHPLYVVWIQAPSKQPQPVGQLRVNADNMEASFRTKTPYKSFDVFVTAEDTATPATPSNAEVLRGSVQK